jgi:predicted NUDIX family NTP pyrophosphohydrolase
MAYKRSGVQVPIAPPELLSMYKHSAGILVYKKVNNSCQVLLGHMGGPFWAKKDAGAWSIPKGEFDPETEDKLVAARREFAEEIGQIIDGNFIDLGNAKQNTGKIVYIFAVNGDIDTDRVKSNVCTMEWPPKSGQTIEVPEIDRAEWLALEAAKQKVVKGQIVFIDRLAKKLGLEEVTSPPSQVTLL